MTAAPFRPRRPRRRPWQRATRLLTPFGWQTVLVTAGMIAALAIAAGGQLP